MKVGILILFNNNENELIKYKLPHLFTGKHNLEVCLVNNGSNDNTLDVLKAITEYAKTQISVLDIKVTREPKAAIRAGARYLSSKDGVKYIVYMNYNMIRHFAALKMQIATNLKKGFFKEKNRNKVINNVFSIQQVLNIK